MFTLTHLVFGIFQVKHEGPVFVLVLAVSAKADIEHFLFNGNSQPSHLTLGHFQIITVTHPGGKEHNKYWCLLFKDVKLKIYSKYYRNSKRILNQTLTSYRGCLSASGGCSVSSGCWAAAWGKQGALTWLDVEVWKMNGWRELKKLEMMGLWRKRTSDYGMEDPFVVAAF